MAELVLFAPSLRSGGAERAMLRLAKRFAATGLQVELLVRWRDGPYAAAVREDIPVIELGERRGLRTAADDLAFAPIVGARRSGLRLRVVARIAARSTLWCSGGGPGCAPSAGWPSARPTLACVSSG